MGATGVEERGSDLVTHIPPPPDPDALMEKLRASLEILDPGEDPGLSWRWQPQEAWEVLWRKGLGPRRITPRIAVTPSWEPVEQEEGHVLVLDPGMAFGTAEHATTRGCIRALDGLVEEGDRIADVGSGSGILAIAAAHLGAAHVMAIEMDAMSCETARENLARNGAEDRVTMLEAEVQAGGPLPEAPFDGIVANLQRRILLPLLPALTLSLRSGAWLVVSGILTEQAPEVEEAASGAGFLSVETDVEDGWWTATYRFQTRND
jgi:ribosomal protein L11 methyltransferase